MKRTLLLFCALLAVTAQAQETPKTPASSTIVLRGRLHRGDGKAPLADGALVITDGRVVALGAYGEVTLPEGARVVARPGAELTPGLIDAATALEVVTDEASAEAGQEVVPHLRVLDQVDLRHEGFARLAARGVTTVCVTASPESVIGARGAVLRTAGPLADRVVAETGPKVTFGMETWRRGQRNRGPFGGIDHLTRRPTTRMGGAWVIRDALFRAGNGAMEGPAGEALRDALAGTTPLRVQARTRGDIENALRLLAEAGLKAPFVLEEGTEARYLARELAAAGVAVIYGPTFDQPRGWRRFTDEADDPALGTPLLLAQAGVTLCLTAADRTGEDGLVAQVGWAIRHGLDPDAALAAVTSTPARLLGLSDRAGALAEGRAADAVLWDGPPFEPTTRVLAVLIDGVVVSGALEAPATTDAPPNNTPNGPGPRRF